MQCPKCKLENPPGTTWCDCGYNFSTGEVSKQTSGERRLKGNSGFDLNDYFSFRQMVSTAIIKILYVCGAIAICLISLVALVRGVTSNDKDAQMILGGVGLLLIGNLLWRVLCEGLILMFSVHEVLVSIEHQGTRSFVQGAK